MKTCIWCNKDESNVCFKKRAHTFPQSLGGKQICENVCDQCNYYFGTRTSGGPSVEIVLKELLHLSQYIILQSLNEPIRLKSEYFDVSKQRGIVTKPRYSIKRGFQESLIRQFKRGIYKIYLEERERQLGDAKNERFNFIREFSRYDLGDYPLYYFIPKNRMLMFSSVVIRNPEIHFSDSLMKLDEDYRFFENQFIGHYFAMPTSNLYPITIDKYKKHLIDSNHAFGVQIVDIKTIRDIDITFQYLND